MAIKFRCPNAACGKTLTVSDEAAGRKGKCPGCGGTLMVPLPEPAAEQGGYELESQAKPEPEPEPEPVRRPKPGPEFEAPPRAASTRRDDDPDWGAVGAGGPAGPVVSFDAIGLAWDLLKRRMGTWVLAAVVLGLIQGVCQVGLMFVSTLAAAVEFAAIGNPFPLSPLAVMSVSIMVQAVLFGGLYRMALKQIDGGDIQVSDLFGAIGFAPGLVLAWLLTFVGTAVGFFFFIIPGLVFAALVMFITPAVVDGLGAVEALKRSVGTLKRQWLLAVVFLLVTGMILAAGALLFGFGLLVTLPLFVLAATVQYRRSFAPGGVPRKVVVADPWAEAVGKPAGVAGSARVPVWAWGVLGLAVLIPLALLTVVGAVAYSVAQQAAQQMAARDKAMQKQMAGFPAEATDGVALLREGSQPPAGLRGMLPGTDPAEAPAPAGVGKRPSQEEPAGPSYGTIGEIRQVFEKIQKGMTRTQVEDALGKGQPAGLKEGLAITPGRMAPRDEVTRNRKYFATMKLVKWGKGKRMILAGFGPDGTAVWRGFVFDFTSQGEGLAMVNLGN